MSNAAVIAILERAKEIKDGEDTPAYFFKSDPWCVDRAFQRTGGDLWQALFDNDDSITAAIEALRGEGSDSLGSECYITKDVLKKHLLKAGTALDLNRRSFPVKSSIREILYGFVDDLFEKEGSRRPRKTGES